MSTKISEYDNGNVHVTRFSDGTVIRFSKDDEFNFAFPENMDVKICNRCDIGCSYCHEGSTIDGELGDILNAKWIDTIHPYTEIALGGGCVFEHPDIFTLLKKLKEKNVYANITLNQIHFMNNLTLLEILSNMGLIHGIGVSIINTSEALFNALEKFPNAVIHVIAGVLSENDLQVLLSHGENIKVLVLGFKKLRRGQKYFENVEKLANDHKTVVTVDNKIKMIERYLPVMFDKIKVVSFDCLAIKQLHIKDHVSKNTWETCYQGEDGTMTFYIDMVNNQFAESSTAPLEKRYDISNKSVDEMFAFIKNNK